MQSFVLRFYRLHRTKVPSDGLRGERVFILGFDIQGWTWVSSSSNASHVPVAIPLSFSLWATMMKENNMYIYEGLISEIGLLTLRARNKRFTSGSSRRSRRPLAVSGRVVASRAAGIQFVCGRPLLQNRQVFFPLFLVLFSHEDPSAIISCWSIFRLERFFARNVSTGIL